MIYSTFNKIIFSAFNLNDIIDFLKIEPMLNLFQTYTILFETQQADFPEVVWYEEVEIA